MQLSKKDKHIFYSLMIPVIIETITIRILNITDSIMVGHIPNSTIAVAAIGLCSSPINLITSVISAIFIGTTATIAWYHGAKEHRKMRTVAFQSTILSIFIAILITATSIIFSDQLMGFVCGESETFPIASNYYKIIAYGFFFQIITANITALFRGIGITKVQTTYNVIGAIVNVFLNYVLIYGKLGLPALGAQGAALATTISQAVPFIIAIVILLKNKTELNFKLGFDKKLDPSFKKRLLPIGLTSAGEQIALQLAAVFMTKIIATLPTEDIAVNQIVTQLEKFSLATGAGCRVAMTTLFGKCLGAKDEPKGRSYLRFALRWALIFAAIEFAIFFLFGTQIASIFSNDTALYPVISSLLLVAAFELPFVNIQRTLTGALRGAGDSMAPLIASTISIWVVRVFLGYLIINVLDMGIYAYRFVLIIEQLIRCIIMGTFYLKGHWKKYAEAKF